MELNGLGYIEVNVVRVCFVIIVWMKCMDDLE